VVVLATLHQRWLQESTTEANRSTSGQPASRSSPCCAVAQSKAGYLPFDDEDISSLYQKILKGDYSVPAHLSAEAIDLLSKILVTDPSRRISFREIKYSELTREHSWLKLRMLFKMQKTVYSLHQLSGLDEETLARLELQGVDRELLRDQLQRNLHNSATATYYLYLKKKLASGGTIVTAEMLQRLKDAAKPNPKPLLRLVSTGTPTAPAPQASKDRSRLTSPGRRFEVSAVAPSPKSFAGPRLQLLQKPAKASMAPYRISSRWFESPTLPEAVQASQETDQKELPDARQKSGLRLSIKWPHLLAASPASRRLADVPEVDTSSHKPISLGLLREADPDACLANRLDSTATTSQLKAATPASQSIAMAETDRLRPSRNQLAVGKRAAADTLKTTRTNSLSRENLRKLRSFDSSLEKWSLRKTSNTSFRAATQKDAEPVQRFLDPSRRTATHPRKTRNPFALDLTSHLPANDLLEALLAAGLSHGLAAESKVLAGHPGALLALAGSPRRSRLSARSRRTRTHLGSAHHRIAVSRQRLRRCRQAEGPASHPSSLRPVSPVAPLFG